MYEIALVGIGMGSLDHLTRAAERALASSEIILVPCKGAEKADLAEMRHRICAEVAPFVRIVEFRMPMRDADTPAYLDAVGDWHDAIAEAWGQALAAHLPAGGRAALLVWGDPSLYDSTLRIAERLRSRGTEISLRVVPGVTSLQMLTAAFAIPLNRLGDQVLITTGRRLRAEGWPGEASSVAVMLDGTCAFRDLSVPGLWIWWGACLGMDREVLRHGPLVEVGPEIVAVRAAERAAHGWIMDTYLLRAPEDAA